MSNLLLISADRTSPSGFAHNLGDALLTDALAAYLRRAGHDVVVADFGTTVRNDGSRAFTQGFKGLLCKARRCDGIVVGGGTMIQDDVPNRRFAGLPRLCLAASVAGWQANRAVNYVAVGVDPIARRGPKHMSRLATRIAESVVVRDERSLARAGKMFPRAALKLGADAALLAETPELRISSPRFGAVIALNRTDAQLLTKEAIECLAARYGSILFLSMDQGPTADHKALTADSRALMQVVEDQITWQTAWDIVASGEALFASRMHALYLAALTGTPAVGVGHSPKVEAFASEYGIECVDVSRIAEYAGRGNQPRADSMVRAMDRLETSLNSLRLAR